MALIRRSLYFVLNGCKVMFTCSEDNAVCCLSNVCYFTEQKKLSLQRNQHAVQFSSFFYAHAFFFSLFSKKRWVCDKSFYNCDLSLQSKPLRRSRR